MTTKPSQNSKIYQILSIGNPSNQTPSIKIPEMALRENNSRCSYHSAIVLIDF
jgi:hypothetical protein